MLEDDIRQLRAILGRVVTLGSDTPQTRPYLNHAYSGLMEALTALEQLQVATTQIPDEDDALLEGCDRAFLALLGVRPR